MNGNKREFGAGRGNRTPRPTHYENGLELIFQIDSVTYGACPCAKNAENVEKLKSMK